MTGSLPARIVSVILASLIAAPSQYAQTPPAAPTAPVPQSAALASGPLLVGVLDGDKAVNSLPLLQSTAPVIEVRDRNDFPVEGATVVFTLPESGPGGTFAGQTGNTFTTRSDSHGQATCPAIVPRTAGRFQIRVVATLGDRKGQAVISQTNSNLVTTGGELPAHPWYKRKLVWAAAGAAVAAVVVLLATRKSSTAATPTTVTITPGAPVFH